MLHVRDDLFAMPDIISDEDELDAGITMELSDHGGHMGFTGRGKGLSIKYWLPTRITDYLNKG